MSANEITDKLNAFVAKHVPFDEECHAVYLLAEVRKILERRDQSYPLVRFYANWTLHSRHDHKPLHVKVLAKKIYDVLYIHLHANNAAKATLAEVNYFVGMIGLRVELADFFHVNRIDSSLTGYDELWDAFVRLLTDVLSDQPIIRPCVEIERIRFMPKERGCEVVFAKPVAGHPSYVHTIAC